MGRFIEALKSSGLYDESLIILTADHGEAFYEHGHWQHSTSLYEELIHVPLIVKWPGHRLRGKVGTLVSHIDIFHPILGELGLQGATISASSLMPAGDPVESALRVPAREDLEQLRDDLRFTAGRLPWPARALERELTVRFDVSLEVVMRLEGDLEQALGLAIDHAMQRFSAREDLE